MVEDKVGVIDSCPDCDCSTSFHDRLGNSSAGKCKICGSYCLRVFRKRKLNIGKLLKWTILVLTAAAVVVLVLTAIELVVTGLHLTLH